MDNVKHGGRSPSPSTSATNDQSRSMAKMNPFSMDYILSSANNVVASQAHNDLRRALDQVDRMKAQQNAVAASRLISAATSGQLNTQNLQPSFQQQNQQNQFLQRFLACMILQQQQQQQQHAQQNFLHQAQNNKPTPTSQEQLIRQSFLDRLIASQTHNPQHLGKCSSTGPSLTRQQPYQVPYPNSAGLAVVPRHPRTVNNGVMSVPTGSQPMERFKSMFHGSSLPLGASNVAINLNPLLFHQNLTLGQPACSSVNSVPLNNMNGQEFLLNKYHQINNLPQINNGPKHSNQQQKSHSHHQTTTTTTTTPQPSQQCHLEKTDSLKPAHSYIGLIAMCILSTPDKRMVLNDIYQFILDNYPYYRNRGSGWRNSVRHNLSLNECFQKAGRAANGKGHYWTIHPANMSDFMIGDFRRRRAQRKVRRWNNLDVPSDESDDESIDDATKPPLPEHFKRSLEMHRRLELSYQQSTASLPIGTGVFAQMGSQSQPGGGGGLSETTNVHKAPSPVAPTAVAIENDFQMALTHEEEEEVSSPGDILDDQRSPNSPEFRKQDLS